MNIKLSQLLVPAASILLLAGIIAACVDPIDLQSEQVGEVIVIEGAVYSGGQLAEVSIKKSGAFAAGDEGLEEPVSGAVVSITEIGGETLVLPEYDAGKYQSLQALGTTGNEYQLRVEVNGNTYTSGIEKMPVKVPISSLKWEKRDELVENETGNLITVKNVVIRGNTTLPDQTEGTFIRYRVNSIYEWRERSSPSLKFCYINDAIDLNNISLVDSREINGLELNDQIILEKKLDRKFTFGTCFTVVQQSITETAMMYWRSVQNEFERTGDIFETPPARIDGNIFNDDPAKDDVIGIFSAVAPDTAKIFLNGLELNERLCQCQCWPPDNSDRCTNCLTIVNSTIDKPECF